MTTAVAPELESDHEAGAVTVGTHNAASSPSDTAGVIAPPPVIYLSALRIGFGLDAVIGTGSLPSSVAVPVGAASPAMGPSCFAPAPRRPAVATDGGSRFRRPGRLGGDCRLDERTL
jgi:hypothetical protein